MSLKRCGQIAAVSLFLIALAVPASAGVTIVTGQCAGTPLNPC